MAFARTLATADERAGRGGYIVVQQPIALLAGFVNFVGGEKAILREEGLRCIIGKFGGALACFLGEYGRSRELREVIVLVTVREEGKAFLDQVLVMCRCADCAGRAGHDRSGRRSGTVIV